jgi:hypothetical protein
MENRALRDFMKMRQSLAEKMPPSNPKKLNKTPDGLPAFGESDMTFSKIVSSKPPAREVIDYFREKVNEIIAESLNT